MTVHVRWPARPAELRAGLVPIAIGIFVTFLCFKTKKSKQWIPFNTSNKVYVLAFVKLEISV